MNWTTVIRLITVEKKICRHNFNRVSQAARARKRMAKLNKLVTELTLDRHALQEIVEKML